MYVKKVNKKNVFRFLLSASDIRNNEINFAYHLLSIIDFVHFFSTGNFHFSCDGIDHDCHHCEHAAV